MASESPSNFAINGKGFFSVRGEDGNQYYTRNGNFQWALAPNGGNMLASTDGLPVIDSAGRPIVLNANYVVSNLTITDDGQLCYPDANKNAQPIGVQIGVFQFNNPAGLDRLEGTLYGQTAASGQSINEATNNAVEKSKIMQSYLEGSNVQEIGRAHV